MLSLEERDSMRIRELEEIKIPIVEIFNSISGEGISAGEVVTFLRVAGCNLRCGYCDTTYSYQGSDDEYQWLTFQEILERLSRYNCNKVICTGGEPLETTKVKRYLPLYLLKQGYEVRIESNGSCPIYSQEELREFAITEEINRLDYTLDIKVPSSKMSDHNIFAENFINLISGDELKFVVGNDKDLNYAKEVIDEYRDILAKGDVIINFSPVFETIKAETIVEFLKENNSYFVDNNLQTRLSLQLHKFIWDPEAKGV
jgi:7-carboxy-7-deazaguanine synthase